MSKALVDTNIVEMQFDNTKFEKNVKQSMNTISKLKKDLDFDNDVKSLKDLEKAAGNVDFSKAEKSAGKFATAIHTVLNTIEMGALLKIGSKIESTMSSLIKSMSVDQLSAGWDKYVAKTANVQTIMNATGKSIEDVNAILAKLMWYSDETSFSFSEMTSALSTMTAAGGDVEKLIPMIEGMANATAFAGKGATEFSRVIYNLNQSYSKGYLQYQDWQSVALAGVNSKQLIDSLIQAAVDLGKIKPGQITKATFASTLKDGWATTEVMERAFGQWAELTEAAYDLVDKGEFDTASEAMEHLAGKFSEVAEKGFYAAQQAKSFSEAIEATKDAVSSGWLRTFETIFGNLEEAKDLWTTLTNDYLWEIFAADSETRNNILSTWKEMFNGGRDTAVQAFYNVLDVVMAVRDQIKTAWAEVFHPLSLLDNQNAYIQDAAKYIADLVSRFKSFSEELKYIAENSESLHNIFESVFTVLKVGVNLFQIVDRFLAKIGYAIAPLITKVFEVAGSFNGLFESLDKFTSEGSIFYNFFDTLGNVVSTVVRMIVEGMNLVIDTIMKIKNFLSEAIASNSEFQRAILLIKNSVNSAFSEFNTSGFAKALSTAIDWIDKLRESVSKWNFDGFATTIGNTFLWIEDAAKSVGSTVSNAVSGVGSFFGNMFGGTTVVAKAATIDGVTESVETMTKACSNSTTSMAAMGSATSNLSTATGTFAERLREANGEVIVQSDVIKQTSTLWDAMLDVLSRIGRALKSLGKDILKRISSIDGIVKTIKDVISIISALNINKLIKSSTGLIGGLKDGFKTISNSIAWISKSVSESLSNFLANLLGEVQKWHKEKASDVIMAIAKAIAILAGSLVVLSFVDERKLAIAGGAITGLFAELIGMFALLQKLNKASASANLSKDGGLAITDSLAAVEKVLLAMSASVLIISLAIKGIAKIEDPTDIAVALGAIEVLMWSMVGITKALTTKDQTKMQQSATGMVAMAFAIQMLVLPITILGALPIDVIIQGGAAVGIMIGVMGYITKKVSDLKVDNAQVIKMAGAFAIVSASLIGVSLNIVALGLIPLSVLGQGGLVVTAIIGTFALLAAAVDYMKDTSKIVKVAAAMAIVGASLGLFVAQMLVLALVPVDSIIKAGATIAGILVVLAAIETWMAQLDGDKVIKSAAAMAIMAGVLLLLVPALTAFVAVEKIMGWESMLVSLGILAAALGVLYGSVVLFGNKTKELNELTTSLLKFGAAVALLGVGMAVLGPAMALGAAALGVSGVALIAALESIVVGILEMIRDLVPEIVHTLVVLVEGVCDAIVEISVPIAKAVTKLLALLATYTPQWSTALLMILVGVLDALALQTPVIVHKIAELLKGVLVAAFGEFGNMSAEEIGLLVVAVAGLVAMVKMISNAVTDFKGAMKGILVLGLLVAEISAMFIAIGLLAPDQALEIGLGVAAVMAVMGELCITMSSMPITVGAASKAALALSAFVGILAGLLTAIVAIFGALDKIPNIEDFMKGGAELLSIVGAAIGGFFGSIIDGFATAATANIAEIGTRMSQFMENVRPFFDGIAQIKSENLLGSVNSMVEAIALLTASNFLDGINNWLFGSGGNSALATFGEEIASLAPYLVDFCNTLKQGNFDGNLVTAAANAAAALSVFGANLPRKGGMLEDIIGTADLATFGEEIASFAPKLGEFRDALVDADLTEEDLDRIGLAAEATSKMTMAAKELKNHDGIWQAIAGDATLDGFGTEMVNFADHLVAFANTLSTGMTDDGYDAIDAAIEPTKSLIEIASSIGNTGGLWGLIAGDNDLASFGDNLLAFGTSLVDFADTLAGGDGNFELVDKAVGVTKSLVEVANLIPESGGLWGLISGDSSMDDFGEDLADYAVSLNEFAESCKTIAPDGMLAGVKASEQIGLIMKALTNTNDSKSLLDIFGEDFSFEEMGDNLANLGEGLYDYYENVSGINSDTISSSAKGITDLATSLVSLVEITKNDVDKFVDSLNKLGDLTLVNFEDIFAKAEKKGNSIGTALINSISKTFKSASNDLIILVKNVGSKVAETLSDYEGDFYDSGYYTIEGFLKGCRDRINAVYDAGFDLGNAADVGMRDALEIHSPSEVGKWNGTMYGRGVSIGVTDSGSEVYGAGHELGIKANDGTKDAIKDGKEEVGNAITNTFNDVFSDASADAEEAGKEAGDSYLTGFFDKVSNIGKGGGLAGGLGYNKPSNVSDEAAAKLAEHQRKQAKALGKDIADDIGGNTEIPTAAADLGNRASGAGTEKAKFNIEYFFEQIGKIVQNGAKALGKDVYKDVEAFGKNVSKIGEDTVTTVYKLLKKGGSAFDQYVDKVDDNGNKIEITMETAAKAFMDYANNVRDSLDIAIDALHEFEYTASETLNLKQMRASTNAQKTMYSNWVTLMEAANGKVNPDLWSEWLSMGLDSYEQVGYFVSLSKKKQKQFNKIVKSADEYSRETTNKLLATSAANATGTKIDNSAATKAAKDLIASSKELLITVDSFEKVAGADAWRESLAEGLTEISDKYNAVVKSAQNGESIIEDASDSMANMAYRIYKESESFATDRAEVKRLNKERDKANKALEKSEKALNKYVKQHDRLGKEMLEEDEGYKELTKEIETNRKAVEKADKAYENYGDTISDNVSAALDTVKEKLKSAFSTVSVSSIQMQQSISDIFAKWDDQYDENLNVYDKLQGMNEQLVMAEEMANEINKLEAKGYVDGLKEYIISLGYSAIREFNSMDQWLVESYNRTYKEWLDKSLEENQQSIIDAYKRNAENNQKMFANLETLMAKGLNQSLLDELIASQNADEIAIIAQMSDEKLKELNEVYAQDQSIPDKLANQLMLSYSNYFGSIPKKVQEAMAGQTTVADAVVEEETKVTEDNTEKAKKSGEKVAKDTADGASKSEEPKKAGKEVAENLADTILAELKVKISKSAGKKLANKFINGFKSAFEAIQSQDLLLPLTTSLKTSIKTLRSQFSTKFRNAGNYLASGFAEGIRAGSITVSNAVIDMANAAIEAARVTLDEHSPSRVFYGIGNYAGQGFVNALSDFGDASYNAAEGLGEDAVNGLTSSFDRINDIISGNVDTEPVIRPVLDITDVQSKASLFNSIFGAPMSSSLAMDISASIGSGSSTNNPLTKKDVQSMIDKSTDRLATAVEEALSGVTVESKVGLEPNAAGIFNVVRNENRAYRRRTGNNGLL